MATYKYKAKTITGAIVNGQREAMNTHQLYEDLKAEQQYLIREKVISKEEKSVVIRSKDLAEFSQELGTMLSSGISLTRTLHIITQRAEKTSLKEIYGRIHVLLQQGILLSDAMEQQGKAFPYLMINMIKAGEASGQLESVAMKLSLHYEKETRLQSKVKGALIYPIIIMCLTLGVVMIIFTLVLPKLFSVFKGKPLPAVTKAIFSFSQFLTHNWLASIVIFALIIAVIAYIATLPKVTFGRHKRMLHYPVLGRIFITLYTARFARGLSSLYSSGLSMVQSLKICKGLVNNRYVESLFPEAIENVKNGVPLSSAIRNMEGFDSKLPASIYVGEESGRINEILDKLADNYDYEAEQATSRLITFIEPVMIIFMAAIIGTVMVSVMVPIYQYYQSIGA